MFTGSVPYDHLEQVKGLALSVRSCFVLCFADGLIGLDQVFEDLHHCILLDVPKAAIIKQGLECFSQPRRFLEFQEELILVSGRNVQLQSQ